MTLRRSGRVSVAPELYSAEQQRPDAPTTATFGFPINRPSYSMPAAQVLITNSDGDGSCFFWAVADCLKNRQPKGKLDGLQLRQAISWNQGLDNTLAAFEAYAASQTWQLKLRNVNAEMADDVYDPAPWELTMLRALRDSTCFNNYHLRDCIVSDQWEGIFDRFYDGWSNQLAERERFINTADFSIFNGLDILVNKQGLNINQVMIVVIDRKDQPLNSYPVKVLLTAREDPSNLTHLVFVVNVRNHYDHLTFKSPNGESPITLIPTGGNFDSLQRLVDQLVAIKRDEFLNNQKTAANTGINPVTPLIMPTNGRRPNRPTLRRVQRSPKVSYSSPMGTP